LRVEIHRVTETVQQPEHQRLSPPTAVQISGGPVVAMLQQMGLGGSEARFREQVGC
jgi:hypothetical protein